MLTIKTPNFEIQLDGDRGYFEHLTLGEDCSGGLWFESAKLVDYDGVYILPDEVEQVLILEGYWVT